MILKVSLRFAKLPDAEFGEFGKEIVAGMTGNAAFPTPPVTMAALGTAIGDFNTKLTAAANGTPAQTAAKNDSRQVLLGILRRLAQYVQLTANNDMPTLLSSNFQAMATERAKTVLTKPDPVSVKNGVSAQLIAKTPPVKNCSMFEIRASPDGGVTRLESAFSGDSRNIAISGLTPGTNYTIQVRALGGSTGNSDWSDPVQHISL